MKRKIIKVSSTVNQLQSAELTKLITTSLANDIRAYNMAVIQETLELGGSLKTAKRKTMYALRDKKGNITHNMDKAIKVAEHFNTSLYASDVRPGETEGMSLACNVQLQSSPHITAPLKTNFLS